MGNAAKVGAITLVFLVLVWGTYLVLGRSLLGTGGAFYRIRFADAGGVRMGTQVRMAGVQIGLVRTVSLASPTDARVEFQLDGRTAIPVGTVAVVPSSLTGLGESAVDLVPPARFRGDLPPGATLEGRRSGPLEGLLPGGADGAKGIAKEAEKTLRATRALLEDRELIGRTKGLLATLDRTVARYGALGARVDGLLAQNQTLLRGSLVSLSTTLRNVERTSAEFARFASSGDVQRETRGLFAELRKTAAEANRLTSKLTGLASDPALKSALADAAKISASGVKIAATSEEAAASAARIAKTGEGIALDGKAVSERLVVLTDRANVIAERAADLEARLATILERFGGRPKAASAPNGLPPDSPARSPVAPVEVRADVLRETDPNYNRVDLTAYVPLSPGRTFSLGLFDAFESNRLTAQYGFALGGGLGYRAGLYAGRPAVGVDYLLGPRLSLRGDLWGLNSPRLDLRARYEFGRGVVGWLGLDRTFGANAPTFGIGIRR